MDLSDSLPPVNTCSRSPSPARPELSSHAVHDDLDSGPASPVPSPNATKPVPRTAATAATASETPHVDGPSKLEPRRPACDGGALPQISCGRVRTKTGRVLSETEFGDRLTQLMQRPLRAPVETFCNFPQVKRAELNSEQLQASVERLNQPYERQNRDEESKPKWISFEVKMGRIVPVATPWKKVPAAERTAFCRDLYERSKADEKAREQAMMDKWVKPVGKARQKGATAAAELERYQARLLKYYTRS